MISKKFLVKKNQKFSTNQAAGNQKSRDGKQLISLERAYFNEFKTGL